MTLRMNGSTSGYTEIDAPAVAGNNTIQLPASNGNAYQVLRNGATAGTTEFADNIVSGTAQASTSGTAINFTGIPAWVKRITVMFSGVSTNGTGDLRLQLGSGSIVITGYATSVCRSGAAGSFYVQSASGVGFQLTNSILAADVQYGQLVITNITGNTWTVSTSVASLVVNSQCAGVGSIALSGALDRLRIIGSTTGNPADTFDAGTINILYE
jgi:hypothetical protein